jgi:hypothetical protein
MPQSPTILSARHQFLRAAKKASSASYPTQIGTVRGISTRVPITNHDIANVVKAFNAKNLARFFADLDPKSPIKTLQDLIPSAFFNQIEITPDTQVIFLIMLCAQIEIESGVNAVLTGFDVLTVKKDTALFKRETKLAFFTDRGCNIPILEITGISPDDMKPNV